MLEAEAQMQAALAEHTATALAAGSNPHAVEGYVPRSSQQHTPVSTAKASSRPGPFPSTDDPAVISSPPYIYPASSGHSSNTVSGYTSCMPTSEPSRSEAEAEAAEDDGSIKGTCVARGPADKLDAAQSTSSDMATLQPAKAEAVPSVPRESQSLSHHTSEGTGKIKQKAKQQADTLAGSMQRSAETSDTAGAVTDPEQVSAAPTTATSDTVQQPILVWSYYARHPRDTGTSAVCLYCRRQSLLVDLHAEGPTCLR